MPKFNMDPKKHPMPSQDPLVRNKNFQEVALGVIKRGPFVIFAQIDKFLNRLVKFLEFLLRFYQLRLFTVVLEDPLNFRFSHYSSPVCTVRAFLPTQ